MATKVNLSKATRKLEALGNVLRRPLKDVADSAARVCAIECAKTSQPFGTGSGSRDAGWKAVDRDIAKVYATPGRAYEDISSPRVRALFWRAYKAGEFDVAQDFLDAHGRNLVGVQLDTFDGGAAHRTAKSGSRGRVRISRPAMIVTNPGALKRYVAKEKDKVGTGKGGWADVARQISGSIRGLRTEGDITANWITRKGIGFGKVSRGGSDEQPSVTIRSTIPYASDILNGTALSRAKAIAHHRMIKNLQIAVQSETRRLKTAA